MLFAALYLLVFSLLILLQNRFLVFGMMPISGLNAAVLLFAAIFYIKVPEFFDSPLRKILRIVWLFFLLVALYRFTQHSIPEDILLFWRINLFTGTHFQREIFFLIFILVLLVCIKFWQEKLFIYMFEVSFFLLIRPVVYLYCEAMYGVIPVLLFRYSGVLDLPSLFVLLVSIDYMVKQQFRRKYA